MPLQVLRGETCDSEYVGPGALALLRKTGCSLAELHSHTVARSFQCCILFSVCLLLFLCVVVVAIVVSTACGILFMGIWGIADYLAAESVMPGKCCFGVRLDDQRAWSV